MAVLRADLDYGVLPSTTRSCTMPVDATQCEAEMFYSLTRTGTVNSAELTAAR